MDLLRHLDGRVPEDSFIHFSVACCRRVLSLITDERAKAVVDATDAAINRKLTWEEYAPVYNEWARAHESGGVDDLGGGRTNEALESICGLGFGHAVQVSRSCAEAVGFAASKAVQSRLEARAAWHTASANERAAQCDLIREIFRFDAGKAE